VRNAPSALSALEAAIEGRLVRAGSAEYESLPGSAWAQHANVRPEVVFSKSEFFRRPLPTDAVSALADGVTVDRASGQARELDFTPWEGAYNRTPPGASAFVHRSERFLLKHAVLLDAHASTREQDAPRAWLGKSWSLVHQWGSGGSFRTSPIRASPTGPPPTTARTTNASRGSRPATTPTTSSASTSRFRRRREMLGIYLGR
jgi:hypothetical protein